MFEVLDIGHQNNYLDTAVSVLETEVSRLQYEGNTRCIKIVHGHGRGKLREAVRDWCREHEGRFQAVVFGEDYDIFHKTSVSMRSDCGNPYDLDLGRKNRAITYLWFW